MPLHLIKLCVGCDSVADLEDWIKQKLKEKKRQGQKPERIHTTRMVPKRAEELTSGGSLYWVIVARLPAANASSMSAPLPTRKASADVELSSTAKSFLWSRGRAPHFRAGVTLSRKKHRAISLAPRRVLPRCRRPCDANCANWGCSKPRYYR